MTVATDPREAPGAFELLVVDTAPENVPAWRAMLGDDQVSVRVAASVPAALDLLHRHDPGLALVDLQSPGLDGRALVEHLRGVESGRHLPIVFITDGATDRLAELLGDEVGAVDILNKPVDPRLLGAKVRVFRELHRQRRQIAERMVEMQRLTRLNALMLGALSHDIRTPLAVLMLNAELVVRRADQPGLKQAGDRIKSATTMLSRQVDHLVNLASLPNGDLRPQLAPVDLAELVRQRLALEADQLMPDDPATMESAGDTTGSFDAGLIAEAVDQLLLLAAIYSGGEPVQAQVDGHSRRALALRITTSAVLPESTRAHLFGGETVGAGLPAPRVGPGLQRAEEVARAHGGSLIGRSRERDGTLFELILPRLG